mmetsp:Transcript_28587/g.48023  ORF Transcript_28587/g.48023 Transcript_28587/m.48023 type:complete len:284 (+) Transcript_28587:383-1234(+)
MFKPAIPIPAPPPHLPRCRPQKTLVKAKSGWLLGIPPNPVKAKSNCHPGLPPSPPSFPLQTTLFSPLSFLASIPQSLQSTYSSAPCRPSCWFLACSTSGWHSPFRDICSFMFTNQKTTEAAFEQMCGSLILYQIIMIGVFTIVQSYVSIGITVLMIMVTTIYRVWVVSYSQTQINRRTREACVAADCVRQHTQELPPDAYIQPEMQALDKEADTDLMTVSGGGTGSPYYSSTVLQASPPTTPPTRTNDRLHIDIPSPLTTPRHTQQVLSTALDTDVSRRESSS